VKYFDKWGKYYLPSISNAHLMQQCNNFKDPGVQVYGGEDFRTVRDPIDELFNNLPPMEPSNAFGDFSQPVNMQVYNNSDDPCVSGDSMIQLSCGKWIRADEVKRGDIVNTGLGTMGTVNCVVETVLDGRDTFLGVFKDGMRITPWHPILHEGVWVFPSEVTQIYQFDNVPSLFSYVMEERDISAISVNGIPMVTLGHNVSGDIREHPFFGTEHVRDALNTMKGYNEGHVQVSGVTRDPVTTLVNGFIPYN